tara:strand:- start:116 stop:307 length:192 start_codon:yes stop_codon:yes gene_type:complete
MLSNAKIAHIEESEIRTMEILYFIAKLKRVIAIIGGTETKKNFRKTIESNNAEFVLRPVDQAV